MRLAVMMMLPKYRSLDEAPEAFYGVCVNQSIHIRNCMVDREVWRPFVHMVVTGKFVRNQYGVISLDHTAQKRLERLASDFFSGLGYGPYHHAQRRQ